MVDRLIRLLPGIVGGFLLGVSLETYLRYGSVSPVLYISGGVLVCCGFWLIFGKGLLSPRPPGPPRPPRPPKPPWPPQPA
jgi:hypothetical protein